jgi:hypothetical protein
MSYELWKVVTTRPGVYDQILRGAEPDGSVEVFELLPEPDGEYPPAVRQVPRKGADGKPVYDEYGDRVYDEEIVMGSDGKVMHRDFAEDRGATEVARGPLRGEIIHLGWQLRVPDSTPCGLYPAGTDFWPPGEDRPGEARARVAKPAAPKQSAQGAATIRGSRSRPVREAP